MKKINFIFGVHNHQPVGNFDGVFQYLFEKSYNPFLNILNQHPKIKCTFHITGPLLEWIQKNHPSYFDILKQMVNRKQVELFSGGMYEPILPIISDQDKLGQIQMMGNYIKNQFHYQPRGMWLAERVWETHLTKVIAEANVEYIAIDDAHFKSTGFSESQLLGYYQMEEQGKTIKVFPISERMRYLVPFQDVNKIFEYLGSIATDQGDQCIVLMDDGEKFGGWPHTYDWVYTQKWLENFFASLEKNQDWVLMTTFSEFVDTHKPMGLVYLPNGSYTEMNEWALRTADAVEYNALRNNLRQNNELEKYGRFFQGGFWRNFLIKYSESNHLHKKMLWVSNKIAEAQQKISKRTISEKKSKILRDAQRALFRGQCNCPYWHGIFGGLYLNHLRFAVYRELIQAEKLIDSIVSSKKKYINFINTDFDKDGNSEIIIESDAYHVILNPSKGGTISEIDYLPNPINLTDVLTRREEVYHKKLFNASQGNSINEIASIHDLIQPKEPGLEKKLFYDSYNRVSLLEHFLPVDSSIWEAHSGKLNSLFSVANVPFKFKNSRISVDKQSCLKLNSAPISIFPDVRFTKQLVFFPGNFKLEIDYEIENFSKDNLNFLVMSEWNLTLLAGTSSDRTYYVKERKLQEPQLNSIGEELNVQEMGFLDSWLNIQIGFQSLEKMIFWRYPIETISQSESGFEKVYQGSCILLGWKVQLKSQEVMRRHLNVFIKEKRD